MVDTPVGIAGKAGTAAKDLAHIIVLFAAGLGGWTFQVPGFPLDTLIARIIDRISGGTVGQTRLWEIFGFNGSQLAAGGIFLAVGTSLLAFSQTGDAGTKGFLRKWVAGAGGTWFLGAGARFVLQGLD